MKSKLAFALTGLVLIMSSFFPGLTGGSEQGTEKRLLTITHDFKVNDDTGTASQVVTDIATDGSGDFVITWSDYCDGNQDIYAQRYNSSRTPQGVNFKVNDVGTGLQSFPSVAMDGSGNFLITWDDSRNGRWDVYSQRYNSSGTSLGSNFRVNDDTTHGSLDARCTMNGSGNFVITWRDGRNGHPDIYAQRYNSAGTPQGANFKVNDDVSNLMHWYPTVAIDGSGNLVITWQDWRNGSSNPDIYAQRYNSAGTPQGANFKANDDAGTAQQEYPAVGIDGSGNFVIAWHDYRNGYPNNGDIYAQRYNSSGIPQGANFKVSKYSDITNLVWCDVARNGSGDFAITWQDPRNGNLDIYAQSYNSSGTPQDSNIRVNDDAGTAQQASPAIAMDGSGNLFIAWSDWRNGNADTYAKVVEVTSPYTCGDANGDGKVTVSDVVYLSNYLFKGGPAPQCPPAPYLTCGDANGDGQVTVSDMVYLVNRLFKGGPPPVC